MEVATDLFQRDSPLFCLFFRLPTTLYNRKICCQRGLRVGTGRKWIRHRPNLEWIRHRPHLEWIRVWPGRQRIRQWT